MLFAYQFIPISAQAHIPTLTRRFTLHDMAHLARYVMGPSWRVSLFHVYPPQLAQHLIHIYTRNPTNA